MTHATSTLTRAERRYMYLTLEDLAPLFKIEGIEFWSIQHCLSKEEYDFCEKNSIRTIPDIDLFNEFDEMSDWLVSLDLVIGISSLPAELAAALGTPVWFLGFSPENYYLRTAGGKGSHDRLTKNAKVISPVCPDFMMSTEESVDETIKTVFHLLSDPRLKEQLIGRRKSRV